MRLLISAILFAGFVCAADTPLRELQTECQPLCEFRNGQLFRFSDASDPVLRVYGKDGRFAFSVKTWVSDVAIDTDGSLIVAAGSSQSGIAVLAANGAQTSFIDTKHFLPAHIAVTADHSIWVLGVESPILRKYTRGGKLLGSYLLRPTSGSPISLMAAGKKLALITISGTSREVIELDGNGNVLGRMPLDRPDFMNFALTSDGNLYTWDQTLMPYGGLVLLDPIKGTSTKQESPGHYYRLIGADGNNLVYQAPGDGPGDGEKLVWFNQPAH